MSYRKIPYAKHPTRGNIGPEDEQDGIGRSANVACLGCGERLAHRRPSRDGRRSAHYAHLPDSQANIARCFESAVHARVKDRLASMTGTVRLPDWHGTAISFSPTHGDTEVSFATPRGTNRHADVVLTNKLGQRLAVEVWYRHRTEVDAIDDYRAARLPALELRISDDDIELSGRGLKDQLQTGAQWLVRPFEPFACDEPPRSDVDSHLMMRGRGVQGRDGRCERRSGDLIARIIESGWEETPEVTYQIEKEGDWVLEWDNSWRCDSHEFLDRGALLFKDVEMCLEASRPRPMASTDRHYRQGDSSWSSTTAVPGIRINAWRRLAPEWHYRLGPVESSLPIQIPFYSVRGLRQYNRHYKALSDAERWARVFQDVHKRWGERHDGIWV